MYLFSIAFFLISFGCVALLALLLLLKFKIIPLLMIKGIYPGAGQQFDAQYGRMQTVKHESLFVTTDDQVKIHAQFFATCNAVGSQHVPSLLYLHGNGEDLSQHVPNIKTLVNHCNILAVEYRGYGLSERHVPCSERGLILDAQACLEYLFTRADIDISRVYIYGRSLGAAVAIGLLSDVVFVNRNLFPVRGLITENAFLSINDVLQDTIINRASYNNILSQVHIPAIPTPVFDVLGKCAWPLVWFVGKCLIPSVWNSQKRVASFPTPPNYFRMLFLVGKADELIPPSHSRRLIDASLIASENKFLLSFPKGNHNDTWSQPGYCHALCDFVNAAPSRINY